ncbi:hypothetical protein LX14_003292 [Williamsia deligens]|nr:hypothetical protein [Williamsia deligens]
MMATVAVYRSSDRSWWVGRVDPAVLGDARQETDALRIDWGRRGIEVPVEDIRPPLLVIQDPLGRYGRGCSTNSHFDARDHQDTDPHADCAHGRAIDRVIAVLRGAREQAQGRGECPADTPAPIDMPAPVARSTAAGPGS